MSKVNQNHLKEIVRNVIENTDTPVEALSLLFASIVTLIDLAEDFIEIDAEKRASSNGAIIAAIRENTTIELVLRESKQEEKTFFVERSKEKQQRKENEKWAAAIEQLTKINPELAKLLKTKLN